MKRKISFAPGEYYHIYNRGVEKRKIFLNRSYYKRFLLLLFLCNSSEPVDVRSHFHKGPSFEDLKEFERGNPLVEIGAYCLMPNHFHLLLKEINEGGITAFMKKLGTAYAMYFNKKEERKGTLFQGRFGAQWLNRDRYLKYMFAYIHLNPIKLVCPSWKEGKIDDINKIKKFLNSYIWSSYPSYSKGSGRDLILNKEPFPEYFKNNVDFKKFINDWLALRNNLTKDRPWQDIV